MSVFVPLQSPPPCVSSLPPWPPVDVWSGPGLYRVHLLCPLPEDTLTTGGEKSTFFPRRTFPREYFYIFSVKFWWRCTVSRAFLRATLLEMSLWARLSFSCSRRRLVCWRRRFSLWKTIYLLDQGTVTHTTRPNPSPQKLSDQVFVHRVFIFALTVHYLEPTLLQLGFLWWHLRKKKSGCQQQSSVGRNEDSYLLQTDPPPEEEPVQPQTEMRMKVG